MEDLSPYLRSYKKRNKALQRRFQIEYDHNKKLLALLRLCLPLISDGLVKDVVEEELKTSKYKYY